MARYRHRLPQIGDRLFLSDGGIETTLIFLNGLDLPHFAAFHLLGDDAGRAALKSYYARHAEIAAACGLGFILESPTWRANADWGDKLGYSRRALAEANREAIALMEELRAGYEMPISPMVISGCIGPRGDGYKGEAAMTAAEARDYHAEQIRVFRDTAADMVTAVTMTYEAEATGLVRAAAEARMPVAVSFTVETDGRLPSGQPLGEAVRAVDAATGAAPAYFMINCAHPTHFARELASGAPWTARIRGVRANASTRSHAELDEAADLDAGDPVDLGRRYAELRRCHRGINVLGGCCGTDHRHVEQIAFACLAVEAAA